MKMEESDGSVLSNEDFAEVKALCDDLLAFDEKDNSDVGDRSPNTSLINKEESDPIKEDIRDVEATGDVGVEQNKLTYCKENVKKEVENGQSDTAEVHWPIISVRKSADLFGATKEDVEKESLNICPLKDDNGTIKEVEKRPLQLANGILSSEVATSSLPVLPPWIQLSKRLLPQGGACKEAKKRKEDSLSLVLNKMKLPDSITMSSVRPQTNCVANLLANRGVTVSVSPIAPVKLSPSVSMISVPQQQPQSRRPSAVKAEVAVLPTVDLTKEMETPRRSMKPASQRRPTCQVCDKSFYSQNQLSQHMAIHVVRTPRERAAAYQCRECGAKYLSREALKSHIQRYHGAGGPSPDMAIPVVDLRQPKVLSKLAQLGIRSVVPLAQLHSSSDSESGIFGVPVVAIDSASNPAICNIGALGASNLLPLGPLKNLTFNGTR